MKRLRRALAFIISALIICSFLSACGDPYKKLRKEDAQIRSAMENADFGHGDKFAVYDHVTQLYSFSAQKIPDELRAKKPEEIGAFIHYDEDGPDGSSPVSMRLIFAFDRDLDFNFMVLPTEVDVICTPPKEKQVAYREPGLSEARDTWAMLRRW